MAGEWVECALADGCSSIDYGLTASASEHETGPRFLRITDIVSGHIDWNAVPHVAADDETTAKYRLHDGDVVLARTGASTGASAYVKNPPSAVFASYLVRLKAKPEFDSRFLAYYLKSEDFWTFIRGVLGDKSAQPNASASTMTKAPLRAPRDKNEQRAIAHILGTLDDKIELNRRMSETLEAMARALFKSWFVDFDPVRWKMERQGAKPQSRNENKTSLASLRPGDFALPPPLAALFPDSFEDSELGEIPRGWEVKAIGDLAEVVGGSTPKTERTEYWAGGTHHWVTPKDLSGLSMPVLLDTERKITDAGLAQISSGLLPKGTVLLSSRAPIGYLAIAEVPVAVNQGFIAMKSRPGISNLFLLRWASAAHDEIVSYANGSTFLEISKSSFRPIPVVAPSAPVMDAFDRVSRPMYLKLVEHERESRTLAALRDALLPKLISGELRVKDAEKFIRGNA
jgi:type I restriction enzyme S subunit